jgi:hypothetical protein
MVAAHVVTTFSQQGYEQYGHWFLRSFLGYWPDEVVCFCFHEGIEPFPILSPRIHYLTLDTDTDRAHFMRQCKDHRTNYQQQPRRFCHKVFAWSSPLLPRAGWRIWLDGDVRTRSEVSKAWLAELLPDDLDTVYLGRPRFKHSETGFVAFNLQTEAGRQLVAHSKKAYLDGSILREDVQTDSRAFDLAVDSVSPLRARSLSDDIKDLHVWPHTPLGDVMEHYKGPHRKQEAYGPA